ncbi:unnamed protein product [Cuscuta europaea]|uniref:Uncharacterized protein n=1 Tax=Cuscuta europaea TaxID=41803 RepID=A0A9P0ZT82_CUSEU|nr:unnamed protein product [Cuscuta europaea]
MGRLKFWTGPIFIKNSPGSHSLGRLHAASSNRSCFSQSSPKTQQTPPSASSATAKHQRTPQAAATAEHRPPVIFSSINSNSGRQLLTAMTTLRFFSLRQIRTATLPGFFFC